MSCTKDCRNLGERRGCTEPEHIKAEIEELVDRERLLEGLLTSNERSPPRYPQEKCVPRRWFSCRAIGLPGRITHNHTCGLRYPVVWAVLLIVRD
jgi:hypothetical protein